MSTTEEHQRNDLTGRVLAAIEPVLADAHFELVDCVVSGGPDTPTVQVFVDLAPTHPLGGRIDLEGVSDATRLVDAALDAADPISEAYLLEVSSPGLERALRTPAHFRRFVGTKVSVKTQSNVPGDRRIEGTLDQADDTVDGVIRVAGREIAYRDIERARTIFVWGGQDKPTGPGKRAAMPRAPKSAASKSAASNSTQSKSASSPSVDDATNATNDPSKAASLLHALPANARESHKQARSHATEPITKESR